jgi:hypothetical protein
LKAANVTPSDITPESSRPRISFTQATRARFVWRGQTHIVGTCPLEILQEFLMHHAAKASLPTHQLRELLELLDYPDGLGRWQAVDSTLVYGVPLPLDV